jgi:hypothetical protein
MAGGYLELQCRFKYYAHIGFWREEALRRRSIRGLPLPFLLRESLPNMSAFYIISRPRGE